MRVRQEKNTKELTIDVPQADAKPQVCAVSDLKRKQTAQSFNFWIEQIKLRIWKRSRTLILGFSREETLGKRKAANRSVKRKLIIQEEREGRANDAAPEDSYTGTSTF